MSHFTLIKTKLRDKKHLVEALIDIGERPNVPSDLGMEIVELVVMNPSHAEDHPIVEAQISIGADIGFKLNEENGNYELYADEQTWNKKVPIDRFVNKLTQQYALRCLTASTKEEGYEIEEQYVADDGAVELVVTKWD